MARTRTLAAVSLLAVAVTATAGVADAAKKKPSCKPLKEQKGCKLRVSAGYFKTINPAAGDAMAVSVLDKSSFILSIRSSTAFPDKSAVCGRSRIVVKKRPKVGKSYKVKGSSLNPVARFEWAGKVKFKSAKKATVRGTVKAFRKDTGAVLCTYNLKNTLKRGGV